MSELPKDGGERQEVVDWLVSAIGWTLHKVDSKPGGKSVYTFWEGDTNGWNIVHKFRADQLRWRYMMGIGLDHIPALRSKRDAIWAEYLTARRALCVGA
jgi:hypothetical protein